MTRIKKWLHEHLWKTLPEHIFWLVLGGLFLLASGATPEEWVKRNIDQLPPFIIPSLSIEKLALCVRIFLAILGVFFIALALPLLRRKPGKGGSGVISGGGGIVVGGHGGAIGGGDGGEGTITGGSGIIIGGDAGGADGPGRGGRSPLERLEEMGLGSDYTRFTLLYAKLRLEYAMTHGGDMPNLLPEEWTNQWLEGHGEKLRVKNTSSGFELVTIHKPLCQGSTTDLVYVPLWRVIEHVARVIGDKWENNHYATTRRRIRQAALDGKIKIRGRREIESQDEYRSAFSDVYSNISPEYWCNSVINVLATRVEGEAEYHTDPETVYAWGPQGISEINRYSELQCNWDEVLRLWPSRPANFP